MTTPTGPFITSDDVYKANSDDPKQIGQMKLNALLLTINMGMTDAEIDAIVAQAKQLRDTYNNWADFKTQLDLRKKRLLGFQAVVLAMDVNAAATAMNTTPDLVTAAMNGNATAEQTRIDQLQQMWDTGQLPQLPILDDPSVAVVQNSDAPSA